MTTMFSRRISTARIVIRPSIAIGARLMSMTVGLVVVRVVLRCCTGIGRANRTTRWLEPWRSGGGHGGCMFQTRILDVPMIGTAGRLGRRTPTGFPIAFVLFALPCFRSRLGRRTRLRGRVLGGFHGWGCGDGGFFLSFLHECSVILPKLTIG